MRNLLLLIFFFPVTVFSQIQVTGKITDGKNPLSFATVLVIQNNKTVTYATSNSNGNYTIKLENAGNYTFKISYIAYIKKSREIDIIKNTILNFELVPDDKMLDEITIKSKSLDAKIRNDTISYNLSNFVKGDEQNLKDIIKQLPGLEIDDNGKIKANGKQIEKLLIDGNDFFGGQHQLATENITPEMVSGITLLNNYSDFSDIAGSQKSGKTALKISINDAYKGKLRGNILLGGGYQNKYKAHTNLFSFGKKINLFFIGNANNIAEQTFTLQDYISFRGGIQKFLNENSTSISGDDLPSFLFNNDNIKSRETQFSALNLSSNFSKKLKINFYSIFNRTLQKEQQSLKKTYIDANNEVILNETVNRNDVFLINNSFLELTYKPSAKTILNYSASYAPLTNNLENITNYNVSLINENKTENSFSFNHYLEYTQKLSKKSILKTSVFQSKTSGNNNLNIVSDKQFLNIAFIDNNYTAQQEKKKNRMIYGLQSRFTNRFNKIISLNIDYSLTNKKSDFYSEIENNPKLSNKTQINRLENKIGFDIFKKDNKFFNYSLGLDYSIINSLTDDSKTILQYLPKANIQFNFNTSHQLKLSYFQIVEFSNIENIVTNSIITDYRNMTGNEDITASTVSKYHITGFQYFIYDLFSSTMFTIGGNYKKGYNVSAINTINYTDYNTNNNKLSTENANFTSFLLLNKKLSKIPFSFTLKSTYVLLEYTNFIDNTENKINTGIFSGNIMFSSIFKKSIINFETGIVAKRTDIHYCFNNKTYDLLNYEPYFNLNGIYKNIKVYIESSVENFISPNYNETNYILNTKIFYKKPKNHWEFSVSANNILNLDNITRIENKISNNYIEENIFSSLPGNIMLTVKYNL